MEVRVVGWPVGVVKVGEHGRCTAAGTARRAWSTGWRCKILCVEISYTKLQIRSCDDTVTISLTLSK